MILDRRTTMKGLAATSLLSAGPLNAVPFATSLLDFVPPGERTGLIEGRSEFDVGPALGQAMATSPGPIDIPAGRFVVTTPARFTPTVWDRRFAPGPTLIGAGIGRTVLINRAHGPGMIDIDAGVTQTTGFRAILGTRLEGFSVEGDGRGGADAAIRLRSCYEARLSQLHIRDQRADGICIPCALGDEDGSNMISIDQLRIENCGGWGIDSSASAGHNENSFLSLHQVFIQNCGRRLERAQPQSGGMRHKGQVLTLTQCAFTINANVGLFIPGEAGLAADVTIADTTFENNHGRHLLCSGVDAFRASQIQMFSSDGNRVTVGCEFVAEDFLVRGVRIDGVVVRATPANDPYVAFRLGGRNLVRDTCRVSNVSWEQFDAPGQTRFQGVSFDRVTNDGGLIVADPGTLIFAPRGELATGNSYPLRLRGSGSTSGEWVAAQLPPHGLSVGAAGLMPLTRYMVYVFDDNGTVRLAFSQHRPVVDPDSGYRVEDGDTTRFYVGAVMTDGHGRFASVQ